MTTQRQRHPGAFLLVLFGLVILWAVGVPLLSPRWETPASIAAFVISLLALLWLEEF